MAATHKTLKESFARRSETTSHPLNSYLFKLMDLKASNLCLSADVSTARELLSLADRLGPSIVVLKTHHDMVSGWDFDPDVGTGKRLAALAKKHGFLIFEDRKFGDIGNTVELQYTAGSARIIDWAHIINVNMVPGKASVASLANAEKKWRERSLYEVKTSVSVGQGRSRRRNYDESPGEDDDEGEEEEEEEEEISDNRKGSIVSVTTVTQQYESAASPQAKPILEEEGEEESLLSGLQEPPLNRGLLILAQMSSEGNFMDAKYTAACVEAAREHKDFVLGFVSQESLNSQPDDDFIHMTPGCQLPPQEEEEEGTALKGDGKGQQYNTPQKLVGLCGTDIVIVGRGILKAGDPEDEAERYRSAAWKAYSERVR